MAPQVKRPFLPPGAARRGTDRFWALKVIMAFAAVLLVYRMLASSPEVDGELQRGKGSWAGNTAPAAGGDSARAALRSDNVAAHREGAKAVAIPQAGGDELYTIVVLTWKRTQSLLRLLKSLTRADYQGDRVKLYIQIDGGSGKDWEDTIAAAKEFQWPFGSKEVKVLDQNMGLAHAWYTCWYPKSDAEHAVILEDDITVSPVFYRFTKNMWNAYGDREQIAGVTLQRQRLVPNPGKYRTLQQQDPFGYKLLGTWGFSPSPRHWRKFLELDFNKLNPHVPGLITSKWFARQRRGKMWSQFWIWYCEKHTLYNIYLTPPNRKALATNWREAGVHFGKNKGPDFQVVEAHEWLPAWDHPPAKLDLYSWSLKKEGESLPPGEQQLREIEDSQAIEEVESEPEPVDAIETDSESEPDADVAETGDELDLRVSESEAEPESDTQASEDVATNAGAGGDSVDKEDTSAEELADLDAPDVVDPSEMSADRPLVRIAKKVQKDNIMFLQLFNEGFVEMTAAWACNVQHMNKVLDRTLFLATDQNAYDKFTAFAQSSGLPLVIHLEKFEAPAQMRYGQMTYYQFILFRATILKAMLVNKVSVFLIESDAVWFDDPVSYLLNEVDPSADVVAMHNDYNSATNINGGFLWLKATEGTTSVISRLHSGFSRRIDRLLKTGKDYVGRAGNEQQFIKHLLFSKSYNPNGLAAKTVMLPSDKFAPGTWFKKDYRASSLKPLVVLNNWISGNDAKKNRAIRYGHWFLNDDKATCVVLDPKVPSAADRAIARDWKQQDLLDKARENKAINNNIGEMVVVQFVTTETIASTRAWIAASPAALQHTLFVSLDQEAYAGVQGIMSDTGVSVHSVGPSGKVREPLVYRASVIYTLLRADLSVFVVEPTTSGLKTEIPRLFQGLPVTTDILLFPSTSLLSRTMGLFKASERTRRGLGQFVLASQKYRMNKITTLPSIKKKLEKVNVETMTEAQMSACLGN